MFPHKMGRKIVGCITTVRNSVVCISDWICKNMGIEIYNLSYILTEPCSGTFFFIVTFIYLISTECLLNRLQYIDFDELLTGY